MKKREITLPTLLGLFLAIGGLVSGLWLVQSQLRNSSKASAEETPREVRISNVSDSSFTVSWITDTAVAGFVQYGEGNQASDLVVSDERDQQKGAVESYFTHYVTIRGLKPATAYAFKIGSGKGLFDLSGQPYKLTTASALPTPPTADVAYGQVVTESGEPAEGALVYLQIPGAVIQSTMVKSSGSWVIPLSTARSADLTSFAKYDGSREQLEIVVHAGPMGTAEVLTTTTNDSPVPPIALGSTYNYVATTPPSSKPGQATASATSKFGTKTTSAGKEFSILSPKTGEGINSSRPEIVGVAPAGTRVTIEVHSDEAVTGSAVAGADGTFSYSVPTDLEPGEHTVTLTAIVNGVKKSVSKKFVVYAAGESSLPSFSATPSATLKPTATKAPTAVPTARVTTTPTKAPTKTPTPTRLPTPTRAAPAATQSGLPQSGTTEWTWMLAILGIGLVVSGAFWYKKAVI